MSALGTSTLLPRLGELSPASLGRWVAASLAHAAALREHDAWLYPADPTRLATANQLHQAWRQWLDDAESLLLLANSGSSDSAAVAGLNELRDAVGWTGAMLQISPATMAERHAQVARGQVYSGEEVRRALRLDHRR